MMKVRTLLGGLERETQEQPIPDFCLPRNPIGLEYEWEGTGKFPQDLDELAAKVVSAPGSYDSKLLIQIHQLFNVHIDHSLRKDGLEFTFKSGYSGSKALAGIDAMDALARRYGFTGSYRTSLHVHLDMNDTSFPEDLLTFGSVYGLVEPFLYSFVGEGRNYCNYCIPWYKHPQQFENFLWLVARHKEGSNEIVSHLKNGKGNKYSGLNYFSIGDFGTVEFRHAPVTMPRDKILIWINMIMRIKQWVLAHKLLPPDVADLAVNIGPVRFLQEVFQTQYHAATRTSRDIEGDFWNGMDTLYQYISAI